MTCTLSQNLDISLTMRPPPFFLSATLRPGVTLSTGRLSIITLCLCLSSACLSVCILPPLLARLHVKSSAGSVSCPRPLKLCFPDQITKSAHTKSCVDTKSFFFFCMLWYWMSAPPWRQDEKDCAKKNLKYLKMRRILT